MFKLTAGSRPHGHILSSSERARWQAGIDPRRELNRNGRGKKLDEKGALLGDGQRAYGPAD